MATKIICCSFEPGSMGGFITICNGVKHSLESHFSKTVAVTKEAFIAACKDRILFNDILGIDIRQGWQNALADAILPFQTMRVEEVDPKVAANVSSELDVQMRGEDAVNADIAAVEKENAKLEKAAKKAAKAKAKKDEKPAEPETPAKPTLLEGDQGQPVPQPEEPVAQEPETEEAKDGQGTVETTDNGSQDARGESDSELPVDGPRAESAQ
jgi:type IV secretory pathway VirB10-like protein